MSCSLSVLTLSHFVFIVLDTMMQHDFPYIQVLMPRLHVSRDLLQAFAKQKKCHAITNPASCKSMCSK